MIRSLLTVLVGLLVGSASVLVLGWLGRLIVPPPLGIDLSDPQALRLYVATAPPKFFAALLAAWAGGAFAGGLAAAVLAARRRSWHAIAVGIVQTLLAGWQLQSVPHPTWVVVLALALFVPGAWLGSRLMVGTPDAPAYPS